MRWLIILFLPILLMTGCKYMTMAKSVSSVIDVQEYNDSYPYLEDKRNKLVASLMVIKDNDFVNSYEILADVNSNKEKFIIIGPENIELKYERIGDNLTISDVNSEMFDVELLDRVLGLDVYEKCNSCNSKLNKFLDYTNNIFGVIMNNIELKKPNKELSNIVNKFANKELKFKKIIINNDGSREFTFSDGYSVKLDMKGDDKV